MSLKYFAHEDTIESHAYVFLYKNNGFVIFTSIALTRFANK